MASTTVKVTGMKKMAMPLAASIPPITVMPMICRVSAPAPLAMARGRQPKMKAKLVISMGRSRSRAPAIAA